MIVQNNVTLSGSLEKNQLDKTPRFSWLFYTLTLLSCLPILVTPYFPSLDGPSHLEIANILYNFLVQSGQNFSHYFQINWSFINTTWLFYIPIAFLIQIASVLVVEKVILVIYVLFFAATIRYLANYSAQSRPSNLTPFLLFPLIYNFALHSGFYSFLLALILSFLTIGYYLIEIQERSPQTILPLVEEGQQQLPSAPGGKPLTVSPSLHRKPLVFHRLVFALLWNLTYFLHPVPFVMTTVILGTYAVGVGGLRVWQARAIGSLSVRTILVSTSQPLRFLWLGLPGVTLILLTLLQKGESESNRESLLSLVQMVVGFHFLWSYDSFEIWMGRLLLLLVLLIATYLLLKRFKKSQIQDGDCLLLSFFACLGIYLLAPEDLAGGGNINLRISVYPYFLLVLWMGGQSGIEKRLSQVGRFAAIAIAMALVAFHSFKSMQISDLLEEYCSARPYIREGTAIASFSFIDRGLNIGSQPITNRLGLGHANSYIAAMQNGINLGNYQVTRRTFPIRFHREVNPRPWLINGPEILAYNQQTPGQIDYVLLWGANQSPEDERLTRIMDQLAGDYQLVYVSSKRGLVNLYEIKSDALDKP